MSIDMCMRAREVKWCASFGYKDRDGHRGGSLCLVVVARYGPCEGCDGWVVDETLHTSGWGMERKWADLGLSNSLSLAAAAATRHGLLRSAFTMRAVVAVVTRWAVEQERATS
jgi:hypothetical protein